MKIKEIRAMSKGDLTAKLEELRKELIKVNAQVSTGTTPKSPGQVKQIKKNIAKIMMVLNEKEIKKPEEVDKKTWVKYAQGAVYPRSYVFVKQ